MWQDMSVYQFVALDGNQGCSRLIHAMRRTNLGLMYLDITGSTNFATLDPTLLRQLDDAIDGNTSLANMYLYFDTNDAADATYILERVVSLKPMVHLCLDLPNSNISLISHGVARFLNANTAVSGQILKALSIDSDLFEGDFAQGWAALQQNQTLETLEFEGTNFDASNTEALLEYLKSVNRDNLAVTFGADVNNPSGFTVGLSGSTFGEASQGAVAASIFVSTPNLCTLGFSDFGTSNGNADADAKSCKDFWHALLNESNIPKSPPRLVLGVSCAHSVLDLQLYLPKIVYIRHLEVQHGKFKQPPLPDEVELQAAIDGLTGTIKLNGSLHSFVGGSGGAVYCKRNKNVPKMLAKAKGNNDAKLQVAKLFVAAIQSPKLQANTLLSAMQVWARRPPYTVLGPSGKAAAKADMLKAQEAYAVATAVWADAAARLDAAQTKVDAQKAAMAKIKAEFEVPAQGTTNLEEFNAVLAGHVEANFTKRMAIASKVEAAAAQKAVDTAKETAAATVPVEDATQEFEQCRTQVKKAFRKVTTKAAQLAAAKAAFLAWA